jgi:EAL and modified HD-GYP domain-containing signal transduction protein
MTGPSAVNVVVGRQSIHATDATVVGYELLFRTVDGAAPASSGLALSGEEMTSDVLFGAMNIGLDTLVGNKRIFCNADRDLLVGSLPVSLPPEQTVIEILESVVIDDDVLAGCDTLRAQGFQLALDDFVWFPGAEKALELASIVKLDVRASTGDELLSLIERCRKFDVTLLAEKVETAEELTALKGLGFELFQGYALQRPVIVHGRTLEASHLSRLRMAALLLGPDLDIDELENVMRAEPGLTYQIMRLAALGRMGETSRTVHTLREAVVLAGTRRVQNWLVLLLARPSTGAPDDALATTLLRARACELIAARLAPAEQRIAFAAGMLSAFDLLLGIDADELSRSLPLADDLRQAAFSTSTVLGRLVRDVAEYQYRGAGATLVSGVSAAELDAALANAFTWSARTAATMDAA